MTPAGDVHLEEAFFLDRFVSEFRMLFYHEYL